MKRKSYLGLLVLTLSIAILFSYCKKGDAGPIGPQGPAGPAGTNGSPGPEGPKGDTGTANVIYSGWLDVAYIPETVQVDNVLDTIGYKATIAVSGIDSALLSGGEIDVYLNLGTSSNPDIVPLPFLDVYSGRNISVEFTLQNIALYSNNDASTVTIDGDKHLQYRYVLIPGSVKTGG